MFDFFRDAHASLFQKSYDAHLWALTKEEK